ncbi:MAG TPA: HAMP domain-containing sensor histidine kinase [Bacteroidales bacterium]|nr:HAMP domain-containing sensor histidine kinase [Bacteroidales bacterium]
MSKKKFTVLIIMMVLSIIGIIWVQAKWILNAFVIGNENFNSAVVSCLYNAADAIESSQRMNFFNNYMPADPMAFGSTSPYQTSNYLSIQSYAAIDSNGIKVRIDNQSYSATPDTGNFSYDSRSYVFTGDTAIVSDSVILLVATENETRKMSVVKRGEEGTLSSRALSSRQEEFLNWVKRRSAEFHNLSDQLISEIYQWEKTLELSNTDVENVLRQTFSLSGIQTPFEYAIIRNGEVQDGSFTKSKKNDFLKSKYMVRLFPGNIIHQNVVLSVIFPARTNYVLGQTFWLLGGSLAFSLFIVATFALSLFFIIRQKKVSEMKSDFINNMTHEFKTPIATISLAADTISNPRVLNDEAKVLQFVNMIKKENSRMNKKVETILQIASLDKKEIEFRFEDISMHTLIDHVIDTIEIQVQQKNGKITKIYEAENSVISGDQEHLFNLVTNLLDNAVKYSPESPDIVVRTWNVDHGFVFFVEDKGIGMTKSVQSKIFERFYRQTSGNVHDVKGFGLGLNYARAIIDAHKGTVQVTSEPGKGSRFEVYLPLNQDN